MFIVINYFAKIKVLKRNKYAKIKVLKRNSQVSKKLTGHCRHYIDNFRSLITQSRININID